MPRPIFISWSALICLLLLCTESVPAQVPRIDQITTVRVAAGLDRPVYATAPPGDQQRLFVVEQSGYIRILRAGEVLAQPYLDISDQTEPNGEQGLLGLAFAPDYEHSGYFFVYFTNNAGDSRLMRYTVSPEDPDRADPDSGRLVLAVGQPWANHNGGNIAFSPHDGMLYCGLGDGGLGGDPGNRAQNPQVLLGKMLRLDVRDPAGGYAIPPDNPFADDPSTLDEIWALGLRNPYRFCFDGQGGDLYIADVGQGQWEEVDFQAASSSGGENYGWRIMEGNHCYEPPEDCDQSGLTLPVHEYDHDAGCSITGGFVYRGEAVPAIAGLYFFGDYCTDRIWTLRMVDGVATDVQDRTGELAPGEPGQSIDAIVGFGQDGAGELYIIDRQGSQGEIYKIVPRAPVGVPVSAPLRLNLGPNYPNPFNPATTIPFALEAEAVVRLEVFAADGRLIRTLVSERLRGGDHRAVWDGRDHAGQAVASGTYFYRLATDSGEQVGRMVMLK